MRLPGMWAARAHTRAGSRRSPGPCRHGCSCCSISLALHPGHSLVTPRAVIRPALHMCTASTFLGRQWRCCADVQHIVYLRMTSYPVGFAFPTLYCWCYSNVPICPFPLPIMRSKAHCQAGQLPSRLDKIAIALCQTYLNFPITRAKASEASCSL